MEKWSVTPKHLLRWGCVNDVTNHWVPGRFVEMGAGTGAFTREFLSQGYEGVCYDLGVENRQILRANLSEFSSVDIVDSLDSLLEGSFDYLLAFEVLEHIEQDLNVLRMWTSFVKPGGRVVASVPAHMKKFGPSDERVGHVRRYEKPELVSLFENAGFCSIEVFSWGYPLGNLTRLVSSAVQPNPGHDDMSKLERSVWSGRERTLLERMASWIANSVTLYPFLLAQRAFYGVDLGDGYVVIARRPD
jgi:SAM-dependent methyltransferase